MISNRDAMRYGQIVFKQKSLQMRDEQLVAEESDELEKIRLASNMTHEEILEFAARILLEPYE